MKRYFFGILAVILAVGFSAFTVKKQAPVYTGEKWFHFTGDNNDPDDLINPDLYELDNETGDEPTICPSADTYRCEILIVPDSGDPSKPDLTGHMPVAVTGRSTP
ncbi:MAG: hypothetical protein JSU05_15980 [Bacteroidetes bacterium]|nr:hypothetical protein [Bacteroidota bacterium]